MRGTVQLTINDDSDEEVKLVMDEQDSSDMDSLLSDTSFYQLTLKDNDNKKAPVIKTSVLACQLLRANLR